MLAVVKPSPLRLWGFLLTVIGGALVAFGSIGNWAAITLGGGTVNVVPTKGIDVWQGKVTLILGVADRDRDTRIAVRASRTPQRNSHRDRPWPGSPRWRSDSGHSSR